MHTLNSKCLSVLVTKAEVEYQTVSMFNALYLKFRDLNDISCWPAA